MNIRAVTLGVAFAAITSAASAASRANYEIVPLPLSVEAGSGTPFMLTPDSKIQYPQSDEAMHRNAVFLSGYINDNLGFAPEVEAVENPSKRKRDGAGA